MQKKEGYKSIKILPQLARLTVQEDFSGSDGHSLGCAFPAWRSFRSSLQNCLKNNPSSGSSGAAVLVEVKQVLHPICSSLRHVDITDTSITNVGLQQLCRKMLSLTSLGEYSISDSFPRSLCVVSSTAFRPPPLLATPATTYPDKSPGHVSSHCHMYSLAKWSKILSFLWFYRTVLS